MKVCESGSSWRKILKPQRGVQNPQLGTYGKSLINKSTKPFPANIATIISTPKGVFFIVFFNVQITILISSCVYLCIYSFNLYMYIVYIQLTT